MRSSSAVVVVAAVLATALVGSLQAAKYTLITSLTRGGTHFTGDLGGYTGADQLCEGPNGGDAKGYVALLKGNPSLGSRVNESNDFYDYNGRKLFSGSFSSIFSKTPPKPSGIIADRAGNYNEDLYVWTGADGDQCRTADGKPWEDGTNDAIGGEGDATVPSDWIDNGSQYCNIEHVLYCVKKHPTVQGDPHFVGFDGCPFDFDGENGRVFAIYSDVDVQVNALFQRMSRAEAAIDGNWMTKLGIRTESNSFLLDPAVGVMHAENGSVINAAGVLHLGDDTVGLTYNGKLVNAMVLVTPAMTIKAEVKRFRAGYDDDYFINIDFELRKHPVAPHGVLGQTARPIASDYAGTDADAAGPHDCASSPGSSALEGEMEDYVVKDGILGTDFAFAEFGEAAKVSRRRRGIIPIGSRALFGLE